MPSIETLVQEIRSKQTLYNHLVGEIETKRGDYKKLEKDSQDLIKELDSVQNALVAVKLILEKITYENKSRLEAFITGAFQEIFSDQNYSIELEIREDTKRPAININLIDNGVPQDIRDSVGGGIVTTLGLLLQIYYIEVYELNKVIFIDEGLKEVSKTNLNETSVDYLHNLLQFLKGLSNERNYKIVVITHDESVKALADRVYQVKSGEVLELRVKM